MNTYRLMNDEIYFDVLGQAKHVVTGEDLVIARRLAENHEDEVLQAHPAQNFYMRTMKTSEADLGKVQFFTGYCPNCCHAQPVGRFSAAAIAAQKTREQIECPLCREDLSQADDDQLVHETNFNVIKPFVGRHMRHVQ